MDACLYVCNTVVTFNRYTYTHTHIHTYTVRDRGGNTVLNFNGLVRVELYNSQHGVPLTGTTQVSASAGIASFTDLVISKTGACFTLIFTTPSSSAVASIVSLPMSVQVGPAYQLAILTQPSGAYMHTYT